jgi:hypothetical protein
VAPRSAILRIGLSVGGPRAVAAAGGVGVAGGPAAEDDTRVVEHEEADARLGVGRERAEPLPELRGALLDGADDALAAELLAGADVGVVLALDPVGRTLFAARVEDVDNDREDAERDDQGAGNERDPDQPDEPCPLLGRPLHAKPKAAIT